jgi:hypothetical protein
MRVLLHTPLKPPDSATPSGDREMARGLSVCCAARPHGGDAGCEPRGARRAGARGASCARALARARRAARPGWALAGAGDHPERFDLWFTYHCYYRKPDWLGPLVTRALGVPYVIAEAACATPGQGRRGSASRRRARPWRRPIWC